MVDYKLSIYHLKNHKNSTLFTHVKSGNTWRDFIPQFTQRYKSGSHHFVLQHELSLMS